ncbi:molybdopterin-dependent oxidoreductase [Endozoicomonas sp. SM1973]|uniref:Molybdopterin-dependent oxidoreductase n=1 Tax=Spartinivicinus marinus TaxID=2994442 RepID=A0A853I0M1_9GAMM|nr:molybdopterin-dependent oxidoreductase [Spartinivicinus marinus]MCX4029800.1 molybdopterin-dependent oxidoreductase [Spartinivicinus marinus]NYZ67530.1 molybdopterin-dependent oxidoreductase [Spartinivicinus marinus]
MSLSRRVFLKNSSLLSLFAGFGVPWSVIATEIEKVKTGASAANESVIRYVKSTCAHCVNFCGINIKLENNIIRSIYPDEARAEFYNHGICPKGVSGSFNTYNPYRIKTPLKRTNPKKGLDQDPGWVEISWDEAFDTITKKLQRIREDDPRKFVWQHGHGKYLIGDKFPKAFTAAFGTPNLVHRTTSCEAARHVADEITWGYHGFLPDINECNYLLNFGANYFEGEQFARWLDHTVTDAKERGMKVVVVEPRLSNSAAKANEWIPVRPGKDILLLLGMARILIQENWIDREFLTQYTNAPNLVDTNGEFLRDKDGQALVWDQVTQQAVAFSSGRIKPELAGRFTHNQKEYSTAFQVFADSLNTLNDKDIAEEAGVPAATIRRLTEELAKQAQIGATVVRNGQTLRYRPVAIHTFRGLAAKQYGVQNWRAGLIVQMLLGSIDAVGGLNLHSVHKKPGYMEPAEAEYPPTRVDLQESIFFPHATHNVAQQVAKTILEPKKYGLPYTPEMQIFYATNRPFSTTDSKEQFKSLEKTYNVVIDIVMSETAEMADIVLPDLTYLESWHLSPTRYTPATKHTAIRQPVTNVFNLPHDGFSIIWELASRLGLRDQYIEQINKKWGLKKNPLKTGRDYSAKEVVENLWLEKTKGKEFSYAVEHGFSGKHLSENDTYLKGVEAKFKGAGKPKMQFYAESMLGTLFNIKETVKQHDIKNIDLDDYQVSLSPLPLRVHSMPVPHRNKDKYPFYIITYKRMNRTQSGNTAMNPLLNALGPEADENFVLINEQTAIELKLKEKDKVQIETRVGSVEGRVKLTQCIRPDTLAVSYHYGQQSLGMPDYARKGIWINSILESHSDLVSGMDSFNDSVCRLKKV